MMPRVPRRAKWDCATILSTYTNTENRPKVLSDVPVSSSKSISGSSVLFSRATGAPKVIKLSTKTGAPVGVPVKGDLAPSKMPTAPPTAVETPSQEDADGGSVSDGSGDGANLGEARRRDETPEERRARKRAVKDARKVGLSPHLPCACVFWYRLHCSSSSLTLQAQRESKKALKSKFKAEELHVIQERKNGRPGVSVHRL
jgi:hypothetical protein